MKPALIYSADGVTPLVEGDDTEERLKAVAVMAFGALKGVARIPGQGTQALEAENLDRYREYVAKKIVDAVGYEMIENGLGIRIQR
jgi:hypothetical protein